MAAVARNASNSRHLLTTCSNLFRSVTRQFYPAPKSTTTFTLRRVHNAGQSANENDTSVFSTIPPSPSTVPTKKCNTATPLTEEQKDRVRQIIRVNQAGELGADRIYRGQHFVLGTDKKVGDVIMEMWEQEKVHLKTFDRLIAQHRVRPTMLRPFWNVAGFALGAGTAILGREAAMACTEAVETVIGEHYNDQLRELLHMEGVDIDELRKIVKQFRDEELHHLETAIQYDSGKAPMYPALTAFIKQGCKAAIAVSKRL